MSGRSDEPPGLSEDSGQLGTLEQTKSQVMDYKDIMLKSKLDLKKKEEEVQEYANKLSKIKSRTKISRRSLGASSSSSSFDSVQSKKLDMSMPNINDENSTDISEAKTPKEKSNLLQKKLAENRKMFEQRSKEITESNRAVEEKVEAIRQQIDETDLLQKDIATTVPIKPISFLSQAESTIIQEKDNKIMELDMKIHQLEAIIIDLQDNLIEKDSVIDARTRAITLMSEDLSKKGKTTLDTLEDTKDEMRLMQSNFILMETSLRDKNDHLLSQLGEKTELIAELEKNVDKLTTDNSVSDTNMIDDLRTEMSLMQENFVLVESSLKNKIQHLMSQLEEREAKLSEASEKISISEDIETFKDSSTNEQMKKLQDQFDHLGEKNRSLECQKEELEKSLVYLTTEKEKKITELESQLQGNAEKSNESETIQKLTKELDHLNKNMIKLKAQHKNKLKNLQKRLDNFKTVSDAHAELVKLGNQVALLEEEKGNLQLSLVDFDELKASTVELQTRVSELEEKVAAQTNDIQSHVDAIATLENQKLDLMQELHAAKQEISALEAENAESENLRVTAELKVVELEEQFDSLQKSYNIQSLSKATIDLEADEISKKTVDFEGASSNNGNEVKELHEKIDILMEKNQELEMNLKESNEKCLNIDKKSSDTDSTESFERISDENSELVTKLSILGEQESEIPENITQNLHRRIENLVIENSDLVIELTKVQEKLAYTLEEKQNLTSHINELAEQLSKLDNITTENSDIVVKLTNIELENTQLKNNFDKLFNDTALTYLETEISHCEQINENQLQLVRNFELTLQNSDKLMTETSNEISFCQNMMKHFTLITTKYHDLERIIQDLRKEKLKLFNEENSEILSQEKDSQSNVHVFSEKIIDLEKKLIEGNLMIDKQENKIISLNENIEKYINSIEELKEESLDMKKIIDGFENEKIVMNEEIDLLKSKIEFKENSIISLGEEFKTTVQIMENQIRDKEMILMSLHNQLSELQEALEEKDKVIVDLQDEIKSLHEDIEKKEKVMSNLQEVLNEKENQQESDSSLKQSKLFELQSEINQLNNQLQEREDSLGETIHRMEFTLAEKEVIITNLKQDNIFLTGKIEETEANLMEKDKNSEIYLQTIERLSSEIVNYKNQIGQNERAVFELQEEIVSLNNTIDEFKSNTSLLETDIQSLKSQLRSQESFENKNKEMLVKLEGNEEIIRNLESKLDEQMEENRKLELQLTNINQQLMQLQQVLPEKDNVISSLLVEKNTVMLEISEKNTWIEKQTKYIEEIRLELDNSYKMMELLKQKHIEDIEMMNNRTEDLFKEIEFKTEEFSILNMKLEEQKKMMSQGLTEDMKKSLEERIIDLERQLEDANNVAQNQLQKMKIIAANLKKKSQQCQEWEAKATDFADELAREKLEKEELNLRIQMIEKIDAEKSLQIQELERQKLEAQNQAETANENVEKLSNEMDLTRDKIESLLQEVATLMSELAKKHQEIESKNTDITQLKHIKCGIEDEFEEFKNTRREMIESLEEKLDSAKEKIKELTEKNNRLEEIHEEIESHMETMTSEMEKKSSELQQRAIIIDEQASKTEQTYYEIEKQSLQIKEQSAEIEKKLLEMQDRSLELEKKSAEIENKIIEIEEKKIEIANKSYEIEEKAQELENKSAEIDSLTSEFASYKERVISEKSKIEQTLEETTERARELGVRMQVMENEYVEQLNTIQNLRTENGLLMSKHAQINERLENAEAESADRQKIIDSLQSEMTESLVSENLDISTQHCDYCDRCQGLVNILEAKLQERNAEIENLDNELANSIGNFLQMRETLRSNEMMRTQQQQQQQQQEISNPTEQYDDLLIKNSELEAKISEMNAQIIALTEVAAEAENSERLRNDLQETCRILEIELEQMKISSRELESEKKELIGKIEASQNQQGIKTQEKLQQEFSSQEDGCSIVPKLFDASKLFTSSTSWDLENTSESSDIKTIVENHKTQLNQLSIEIESLNEKIQDYKEEIQRVGAKNMEINEEKLHLLQLLEEKQKIYEDNEKILREKLKNLSEEKVNYISIINEFISRVKNTFNENSLELPSEIDSTIVRSKLHSILMIIDRLNSNVSDNFEAKSEIIQEEGGKCEEAASCRTQPCYEEIKLDDDEVWGWNSQEAELYSTSLTPICSSETQLEVKVAELEDTIKDLEEEKVKLTDEIKVCQIRSGKLVKKLKEFKIQNDSLQQQLKLQLSSGGLCNLDSAIEEELKSQVEKLEKYLAEMKNENEKLVIERDQLVKRIDVLMAGHERFTEMKERQDREVEVLQIQNKELLMKIGYFEKEFPEKSNINKFNTETEEAENITKEKFDDLERSLELLATENEDLRLLIEDEKNSKLEIEAKLSEQVKEFEEERNQKIMIETKLEELIHEIEGERSQRIAIESKLMEQVKKVEELNAQTYEIRNQFDEDMKNQRIQELENEIIEKTARIKILEENLEKSQLEIAETNDSLENVTGLLNIRVQEVADLKMQIHNMHMIEIEVGQCNMNVKDSDKKIPDEKEKIEKIQYDNETEMLVVEKEEQEEKDYNKIEMEKKINEIIQLSSKIEEMNSEKGEILSRIDNQAQEISFLKNNLEEKEWLLEKLHSEISIEKEQNSSNQEKLRNSVAKISQLQDSIDALEQGMITKTQELFQKEDKTEIAELRTQLSGKIEEIEDLKYILNESTYPRIFQELQDNINKLYEEKMKLETALASAQQKLKSQIVDQEEVAPEALSYFQDTQTTNETTENLQGMERMLKFKDEEIGLLTRKLEKKNVECSLLENALAKQLPHSFVGKDGEDSDGNDFNAVHVKELTSSELDVALYMLHQRDVRCEELTHELMQLLEERDTLQLRLSNAIRSNEELRSIVPAEARSLADNIPVAEDKSPPRKSDSEERVNLAEKLSQLHNVGHRRDVRLMDDRELRHTQQMSLLTHKEALSTLPPDAAARLINANYTLSRDVQSQSSVLMNWLWGKSTPKVVHM